MSKTQPPKHASTTTCDHCGLYTPRESLIQVDECNNPRPFIVERGEPKHLYCNLCFGKLFPDRPNPFKDASVEDQSRWYGTTVTVIARERYDQSYVATVTRVFNKGSLIEVKPEGFPTTYRVPYDRIIVRNLVDASPQKLGNFKFNDEARPVVSYITEHLKCLNQCDPSSEWGAFYKMLATVVDYEAGPGTAYAIDNGRYGFNFGGNGTWLEDVEVAITNAREEAEAAKRIRCAGCSWDFTPDLLQPHPEGSRVEGDLYCEDCRRLTNDQLHG